jgi:hypothetical protein
VTTTLQTHATDKEPTTWKITITAEAPNDVVETAADCALQEVKMDHDGSSLSYREEILARSYMLGTVRAIHHIVFTGEPKAAEEFFRALKRRIDLAVMRSPHYRIIEETPVKMAANPAAAATRLDVLPTTKFDTSSLKKTGVTSGKAGAYPDYGAFEPSQTSNETRHNRGKYLGRWFLLGLSLLLLLLVVLQKTLSRRTTSVDTKEAIARMYLTRHCKRYFREVSRQEVQNGMQFQFQNGKHRYNVVVDNDGHIRSCRKIE